MQIFQNDAVIILKITNVGKFPDSFDATMFIKGEGFGFSTRMDCGGGRGMTSSRKRTSNAAHNF